MEMVPPLPAPGIVDRCPEVTVRYHRSPVTLKDWGGRGIWKGEEVLRLFLRRCGQISVHFRQGTDQRSNPNLFSLMNQ